MKTLLFLRHGTAGWDAPDDINRTLTKRGYQEAQAVAAYFEKEKHHPELLIYSPAKRAKATASIVHVALQGTAIELDELLYPTTPDHVMKRIGELDDQLDTVLFVAHNPGLSDLATSLTGQYIGLSPANMVAITFEMDSWHYISPGLGTLQLHFSP